MSACVEYSTDPALRVESLKSGPGLGHWSAARRTLHLEGSSEKSRLVATFEETGHSLGFVDMLNAARRMIAASSLLYASDHASSALDYSLHRIVDLVEERNSLALTAVFVALVERVTSISSVANIPREVDLWIGVLTLTRKMRDTNPNRSALVQAVHAFVSKRADSRAAHRLLRNTD